MVKQILNQINFSIRAEASLIFFSLYAEFFTQSTTDSKILNRYQQIVSCLNKISVENNAIENLRFYEKNKDVQLA